MIRSYNFLIDRIPVLDEMLESSKLIYNQALYHLRHINDRQYRQGIKLSLISYEGLYHRVKDEDCYIESCLDTGSKQYIIKQAREAMLSFICAAKAFKKDKKNFLGSPKPPKYIKQKNWNVVSVDKSRFKHSKSRLNIIGLPKSDIWFRIPAGIKKEQIKQVKLVRFYNKIKVSIIYEKEQIKHEVKFSKSFGIDLGINNTCAITANDERFSCIIKGGPMKSTNQFYNKKMKEYKKKLTRYNGKQLSSHRIERLAFKHYNKIKYMIECISRRIINLAVDHHVGNIVIGHNKCWKQKTRMMKKSNQNFCSIPFNLLINRIKDKAEEYEGINVAIVEESYTSKCDHLALEEVKHHESYLGQRIKRGLFKSSVGKIINADINGAIGILRKANAITDDQLKVLRDRGDIVSPSVLKPYLNF